jgi:hypothetical protein
MYAPPAPVSYGTDGYAGEDGASAPLPQTNGNAPYGRADVPPQYPQPRSYGGASYGRGALPPIQPPQSYSNAPYGRADVPPQYPQPRSYGGAPYGRAHVPDQDQRLVWKSSPRWATVKSNAKSEGTGVAKRKPPDKFKLAQAKAAEVGVENLTAEDIEGLTSEQIKELRGY